MSDGGEHDFAESGDRLGILLDAETRFDVFLRNTKDVFWIADLRGNFRYVSDSVERLFGYRPEEFKTLGVDGLLSPEYVAPAKSLLEQTLEGARLGLFARDTPGMGFELLHRHKSGRLVWCEVHFSVLFGADGAPEAVGGITSDIDDRKRYELALKASETRYRAILSQLPDAVVIHRDDRFIFASDSIEKIAGWKPAELIGRGVMAMGDPELAPRLAEIRLKRSRGEPVPEFYESRFLMKEGGYRDIEVRATLIDIDGLPTTVAVLTDITERKRILEAVRESEAKFRDLVQLLPVGVFEMDESARPVYVNDLMFEIFGYQAGIDPLPESINDIIAPEDRDKAREIFRAILEGGQPGAREYSFVRKDGSRFYGQVNSCTVVRNGRVTGIRGVVVDVTERRMREREQFRANKLEAIGALAGGIAHDFNNILTGVMGNLSLAGIEDGIAETRAYVKEAERQVIRARELTNRLIVVAKGGVDVRKDAPVAEIIGDVIDFHLKGSKSSYWVKFGESIPAAAIDADSFSQIVANLVMNADQAMPEGGVVEVDVGSHRAGGRSESKTERDLGLADGDYLRLSVRDSGAGIAPEGFERLFDPYYSTKPGHSGLGLAVVQALVEKNGGRIRVESEPGRGSRFVVYLPSAGVTERA